MRANVAWDVRRWDEIASTNSLAADMAREGAPEGLVVVADHQTAGRGRLGRTWQAPPGSSLLVSILLRPGARVAPARAHLLTAAVGLAAVDACREVAGVATGLKWPNDVIGWRGPKPASGSAGSGSAKVGSAGSGSAKVGGILAESTLGGEALNAVVVGLGLNVNWPDQLPADLQGQATALNHLAGVAVDREALLVALLASLDAWYARLPEIVAAYRQRCVTLGQTVSVDLGDEVLTGRAEDLSDEGFLGVRASDGDLRWIAVGDVTHVRPAE